MSNNTGFRYCNLIDSDFFDTQSRFNYVAFNDSPEKFLVRLVDRVKVVGVSATATFESTLVNYDINYLKKRWGKSISYPDAEDKKRIEERYNKLTKYYDRVSTLQFYLQYFHGCAILITVKIKTLS